MKQNLTKRFKKMDIKIHLDEEEAAIFRSLEKHN